LGCAVVEWLAGVPAKLPIRISEIISGKADGELRMEVAVESFQWLRKIKGWGWDGRLMTLPTYFDNFVMVATLEELPGSRQE